METTTGLALRTGVRTFGRIVGPVVAAVGALIALVGLVSFLPIPFTILEPGAAPLAFLGGILLFAVGAGLHRAATDTPAPLALSCQHCGEPVQRVN